MFLLAFDQKCKHKKIRWNVSIQQGHVYTLVISHYVALSDFPFQLNKIVKSTIHWVMSVIKWQQRFQLGHKWQRAPCDFAVQRRKKKNLWVLKSICNVIHLMYWFLDIKALCLNNNWFVCSLCFWNHWFEHNTSAAAIVWC